MSVKYEKLTLKDLREKAKSKGCVGYSKMKKEDIIVLLRATCPKKRSKSKSPVMSSSPSWNPRIPQPQKGVKLEELTVEQLRQKAKEKRCVGYRKMKKADLINEIRTGCKRVSKSVDRSKFKRTL